MARELYRNDDETYRARIFVWKKGTLMRPEESWVLGPYKTKGTAKGVASQKTRWHLKNGYEAKVVIERAEYVWTVA